MQRALVIAILVVGCGKPAGQAAPPPAGGRDAAPADAPVRALVDAGIDAATAFAPRAATPDELAAAQAFVDRWLATQNGGDFAAYQALYAAQFRGVRRTGRAVRRFDQAGWFADRKVMFKRPMVVAAEHLVAYVAGPERQVFFTQTWSQGRFQDVGTKNLILEGTGAATKIRYEELLGSRVVPATPPPAVASGGDTWFGYDRAATLATMRVAAIADGRARLAGTTRALPIIDAEVLDEVHDAANGGYGAGVVRGQLAADDPLRALTGQPVVVLDDRLGEACRGTIADVAVEAAGYVDAGPAEPDELPPLLWKSAPLIITAAVTAPCSGAFVKGVDAPALAAVTDLDRFRDRAARKAGKDLGGDGVDATLAAAIDDGQHGFALWTLERVDSCEAPELHERALYAATLTGGAWQVTEVARLDGSDLALTVADVDGDGALDAIVDGGIYRAGRFELWRPVLAIPWPAGLGCDGADGD